MQQPNHANCIRRVCRVRHFPNSVLCSVLAACHPKIVAPPIKEGEDWMVPSHRSSSGRIPESSHCMDCFDAKFLVEDEAIHGPCSQPGLAVDGWECR